VKFFFDVRVIRGVGGLVEREILRKGGGGRGFLIS